MATTSNSGSGSSQSSPSHSEVGHIKNLANFNVLINTCTGFGSTYAPTNTALSITALQLIYNNADAAITNCVNNANTWQQTINARFIAFANVKQMATRILAALIASGADAETIKNAQTYNRKIHGSRAAKNASSSADNSGSSTGSGGNTGGGNTGGNTSSGTQSSSSQKPIGTGISAPPLLISVSQQSYDRLVANLKALVNYVNQLSIYHPAETDLQTANLNTYAAGLLSANNNVIVAHVNFKNTVAARTTILYKAGSGLVPIAFEVKSYVASVYGSRSAQALQVNHISFRNLGNRH